MATKRRGDIVDAVMQSAHCFALSSSSARNGQDATVHHERRIACMQARESVLLRIVQS